jgi:phosphate transport system permease protein
MARIFTTPRSNIDDAIEVTVRQRLTSAHRDVRGGVFQGVLIGCLVVSLLILLVLVLEMWVDGGSVLTDRLGSFLTSGLSREPAKAGLWDAIWGTMWICAIVAVVAFPIGIAGAVYLEEYAGRSRFARLTQINVRNLAGVPSIVYGILGLAVFVRWLGDHGNGGLTGGRSVISGGLTLAVLVLPIVVITTTEALRAVPQSIREGALAVGATRWETVRSHVLPSAAPGILTGTVISLARAAGEAAPRILVGAVTGLLNVGDASTLERLQGPFTAIPIVIFSWARQPGEDWAGLTAAASLTLLAIIFLMNGFAIWLRNRYERAW